METRDSDRFDKIDFVFLDREGVLNRKPPEGTYVSKWEEFQVIPGVETAISHLNRSGRTVIVVTNQRCVALGLCTEADVVAIHLSLQEHLAHFNARLDGIYFCPHDNGQCGCRKPATGMFQQAFQDFPGASPSNSVMVGDSLTDIEAGVAMGMRTILIEGDPAFQKAYVAGAAKLATASATSLKECVDRYLAASSNKAFSSP